MSEPEDGRCCRCGDKGGPVYWICHDCLRSPPTPTRDLMCKSCGSNIAGASADMPHMCSTKTQNGQWSREIPLHKRHGPMYTGSYTLAALKLMGPRECDAYNAWVEKHHDANALVFDDRTGFVVKAIYDCPMTMDLTDRFLLLKMMMAAHHDDAVREKEKDW